MRRMSNKIYGLNYERKEKKHCEEKGFTVMRSRGSFGMFDLIMCHKFIGWKLVSVKSTRSKKFYVRRELEKIKKFDNAPTGTQTVLVVYTKGKREVFDGGTIT